MLCLAAKACHVLENNYSTMENFSSYLLLTYLPSPYKFPCRIICLILLEHSYYSRFCRIVIASKFSYVTFDHVLCYVCLLSLRVNVVVMCLKNYMKARVLLRERDTSNECERSPFELCTLRE